MHTARRTHGFQESVIRGMTRLAAAHGAINLAQGFPDFPCPDVLKEAAVEALRADRNQYAITWGARRLREAVARKYHAHYALAVDPEEEVTVTCGATEAMAATLLLSSLDDVAFARELILSRGVACVPGSSFYARPDPARRLVRFAFCKTERLLAEAGERLVAGAR